MFAADDEDGDFLSPAGGAKLASLFGLDQAASHGNESFQYTAPKQPRKSTTNSAPTNQKVAPPPGSPAVLYATAVHAYRFVNGQYVKQGKLGAAVLGHHAAKEYKILLYASQQKQVTAARIHPAFVLTVQTGNYCTFYDEQRQNWSLMFESEKTAIEFCKEVCVAKANCTSPPDAVVSQDLLLGEGQGVENGDLLEVVYTGWLLQNNTIGQMFDSNVSKDKLLRLKLGTGKVIKGWEEGMLNMRKGGKRLMVIPPSLAYGSQGVPGRIPPDSTLVFEAELRRVKFAKETGSERGGVGSVDSSVPSPVPSVDSLGPDLPQQPFSTASAAHKAGEPPLRAKSNSLSEQLANPDATKAKLISRMAKMGQPMLPFITGPASSSSQAESSDSELEDPSLSRLKERPPVPVHAPQPVHLSAAPSASLQALMPVSMASANQQPVMPPAVHAFQPVAQMYPTQTVPYQGSGDVTSFLMTEARQHNTEIRLAVNKVADKVDSLTAKMEELHRQGGLTQGLSNVSMETAMIMHNIQRIIQENECLKKEVFEKSSRIEEQNRKIGELINQNQRYMEQSNLLMEQRNDSMKNTSEQSQARMLQAEQDKHALPQELGRNQARLTEELASSTAKVSELQLELSAQRQKASGLQTNLNAARQASEQQDARLTTLECQLQELKQTAEQAQSQFKTEKQKRKEAELKLSNLDEELQDLKSEKESLERVLSDRKRKWQSERQRCDEELEEVRKASQLELDNLRNQLRKSRSSTDHAAAEQLAQVQAEVEREWKAKCDRTLASAREQHGREITELTEQRDALQHKLLQLQEKFSTLKQSREEEEQRLLQQQEQGEELQTLRHKCSELEQRAEFVKQKSDARVAELERRLAEQQQTVDTAGEVKRVMNGVFHSLRGEFDLHETYTGSVVLGLIVNTIKDVTLKLLSTTTPQPPSAEKSEKQEEEDEDEEEEEKEIKPQPHVETLKQEVQVNGRKGDDEEEEEEEEEGEDDRTEVKEEAGNNPETVDEKNGEIENKEREGEKSQPEDKEEQEENVSEETGRETHPQDLTKEDEQQQQEEEEEEEEKQKTENKVAPEQEVMAKPSRDDVALEEDVKADLQCDAAREKEVEVKAELSCDVTRDKDVKAEEEVEADLGPLAEPDASEVKPAGPPKNPPPPPSTDPLEDENAETKVQSSSPSVEEPFFQIPAPTKPPPPPTDEEEEELSLKGRPPPAPLFGDDSDDDDLDWLS